MLASACFAQTPTAPAPVSGSAQAEALEDLDHGKTAEAIALLQKIAADHPDQKGVQHELGLAYYRTGKLMDAKQAFERAMAQDPKDAESVQLEGLTLYRLGAAGSSDSVP